MLKVIFAIFFQRLTILIAVVYLTLVERKIMATIQRRCAGLIGLLQSFADGLKLCVKKIILTIKANKKFLCLIN